MAEHVSVIIWYLGMFFNNSIHIWLGRVTPALICFVISHKWAIHTLRRYRGLYGYTSPVVVRRSSGQQKVIATEPRRCCAVTVAQAGHHTRARPPPPARSNPRRPRPANHRTGHLSNQQVTSMTRPVTGRSQPEPTPDKREKEPGPGNWGLPGDKYHYINIHFHAYPYSHVYIYAETAIIVSDICYDNYQRIRQNWNVSLRQTNKTNKNRDYIWTGTAWTCVHVLGMFKLISDLRFCYIHIIFGIMMP